MSMDASAYLLVLNSPGPRRRVVGRLGTVRFEPGFYVYAGSGGANVLKRVTRHLRATKVRRWHIDYLTGGPRRMRPVDAYVLPARDECELAVVLAARLDVVRGFGSSDCRCTGHLFHAPDLRALSRALEPLLRAGR